MSIVIIFWAQFELEITSKAKHFVRKNFKLQNILILGYYKSEYYRWIIAWSRFT